MTPAPMKLVLVMPIGFSIGEMLQLIVNSDDNRLSDLPGGLSLADLPLLPDWLVDLMEMLP
jgi:hypothetical protein